MVSPARQEVYGPSGLIGTLPFGSPDGGAEAVIELTDGGRAVVPGRQLTPRREGGFYLPISSHDLRRAATVERVDGLTLWVRGSAARERAQPETPLRTGEEKELLCRKL